MSTPNGFGLAGIIGMPVAHSRSPTIHNFWLNAHGIRGAYVPLAVSPERLKDALPGLVALGFRGCNVTMPHKQTAMALLHKAVAMGYRNADTFRTESALDHLRGRPDFRLLLMDLAIPADPFAAPR